MRQTHLFMIETRTGNKLQWERTKSQTSVNFKQRLEEHARREKASHKIKAVLVWALLSTCMARQAWSRAVLEDRTHDDDSLASTRKIAARSLVRVKMHVQTLFSITIQELRLSLYFPRNCLTDWDSLCELHYWRYYWLSSKYPSSRDSPPPWCVCTYNVDDFLVVLSSKCMRRNNKIKIAIVRKMISCSQWDW